MTSAATTVDGTATLLPRRADAPPVAAQRHIAELPLDDRRGSLSMAMFIATEAMLFVALFFAYFFIASGVVRWPMDEPPKLPLALTMLVVLLASSAVIWWAERASRRGNSGGARLGIAATLAMAVGFMTLQVFEYRDHWKTLQPQTDAYGSIFYTITSFHALHVMVGMAMLGYVLLLPDLEGRFEPPHRPLHNAALYWHFVDAVWVVVVALLYLLPNFRH